MVPRFNDQFFCILQLMYLHEMFEFRFYFAQLKFNITAEIYK